ncbi:ATP synthase subunit I [Coxiella endosymbiont of Amblyomma nuttalli]|uniref:ATP synthase subunit I n=1 Tax=Coxiella endosymbiont of Amblyomma nuttalli TaxID=2749996 RepID=UPI001FD449B1|nr:ATP synthase subunit I [Coxiella endosymbiont of Amblyomma nuttalli]
MRQKSFTDSTTHSVYLVTYRLMGLQAVAATIIALCWWLKGATEALSAFLGGAVCMLPNFYFARHLFAVTGSLAIKRIMINFFLGELIKLGLSAMLVILVVIFIPVAILPFIVGFAGAQFAFWFAPLWILGS